MTNKGKIIRIKYITRQMVRENRHQYYVFSDNMIHKGYGGQAKEMRGEINSIGIPTKWKPDTKSDSYFSDSDLKSTVIVEIDNVFMKIQWILNQGGDIIIPSDGIGTGLAKLELCAPKIFHYIQNRIKILEEEFK